MAGCFTLKSRYAGGTKLMSRVTQRHKGTDLFRVWHLTLAEGGQPTLSRRVSKPATT